MNTPNDPMHPSTILIIENEISNRILVERVLSTRGYRCISASHGREALQILEHEHVDLILTDLSMPVLDGYRTTQLIRARPGMETIPIVAVSRSVMRGKLRNASGVLNILRNRSNLNNYSKSSSAYSW